MRRVKVCVALWVLVMLWSASAWAQAPTFSASAFSSTIAPGSATLVTFDIVAQAPTQMLDFSVALPAGLRLAPGATSNCMATISGSGPITVTINRLGAQAMCRVEVPVVADFPGSYMITSGTLTSSQGSASSSSASVIVDAARPGVRAAFSPAAVRLGQTTRLRYEFDALALSMNTFSLSFNATLPATLDVVSTALVTDCPWVPTLSGKRISFFNGFLMPGQVCSIELDVRPTTLGTILHRTDDFSSFRGTSGVAIAGVEVTNDRLFLTRTFADPVSPGGVVTATYTIQNFERVASATNIAFTDDLRAPAGLQAQGLSRSDVCGAGSTVTGTDVITLAGASLPPEGSCTFTIPIQVAPGVSQGEYSLTTSDITGDVGGRSVTAAGFLDTLSIQSVPQVDVSFVTQPVAAGATLTAEYTLTNTSLTGTLSAGAFTSVLSDFLVGATPQGLPTTNVCGAGSQLRVDLNAPAQGQQSLRLVDATLPPMGSCTFLVVYDIALGTPPGDYAHVIPGLTATVDGVNVVSPWASATATILGAPALTMSFLGGAALPGSAVEVEYTLRAGENLPGPATGLGFTHDFDAMLSGLVAEGLPLQDVCGAGSMLTGTSALTLAGAEIMPNTTCTFQVTLRLPATAPSGAYMGSTSEVLGVLQGLAVRAPGATDVLDVGGLLVQKRFVRSPVSPGSRVQVEYTWTNLDPVEAATALTMTDNFSTEIRGATVTSPMTMADVCGAGSSLVSVVGGSLTVSGGSLAPGASCAFMVEVEIPTTTTPGQYTSRSSAVSGQLGAAGFIGSPAIASLQVVEALGVSARFTAPTVRPGEVATMEVTLTNATQRLGLSGLSMSVDLDGALPGLVAEGLPLQDVCGAGSGLTGAGLVTLSGGALLPLTSCTFQVAVRVPAVLPGGRVSVRTGEVTGTLSSGGAARGEPADATIAVERVAFRKSFAGSVRPGETVMMRLELENASDGAFITGLSFTDDLDAWLPGARLINVGGQGICGSGSTWSGSSFLTVGRGVLGPLSTCSFELEVAIPASARPGMYENVTSALVIDGVPTGLVARATLEVLAPPEEDMSMDMSPDMAEDMASTDMDMNTDMDMASTDMDVSPGDMASTDMGQKDMNQQDMSPDAGPVADMASDMAPDMVGGVVEGGGCGCVSAGGGGAPDGSWLLVGLMWLLGRRKRRR